MIGNLVSSILPGITSKAAAEWAPARQPDEDAGRAAMAAVLFAEPGGLMAALRALQNPSALFEDDDEPIAPHRVAQAVETGPVDDALPHIDAPAVLTRPGYTVRIMVAAIERIEDEHGGRITRLRLDATIPLTGGSHDPAADYATGHSA